MHGHTLPSREAPGRALPCSCHLYCRHTGCPCTFPTTVTCTAVTLVDRFQVYRSTVHLVCVLHTLESLRYVCTVKDSAQEEWGVDSSVER